MSRIWWCSLCFFFCPLLSMSSPIYAQKISRNVPYGAQSTSGPLTLDVYEPASSSSGLRPLVIFVHGGGFRTGDKSQGTAYATDFTNAGFVFASIDYRLTGEAIFPAAPTDVLTSIRYFRANAAQWNIDPARIGLFGTSAGANLVLEAAMLGNEGKYEDTAWAGTSQITQAVVSHFGPCDFVNVPVNDGGELAYLGGPPTADPVLAHDASPISWVDADDPPTLIFHGEQDPVVSIRHSELMFARLQETGVVSEFVRVANAGHGFVPTPRGATVTPGVPEIRARTVEFFRRILTTSEAADTTPPRVSVVAPAQGAVLVSGASTPIQWSSSDNTAVTQQDILFSRTGGNTFDSVIATGIGGTTTRFEWQVGDSQLTEQAVVAVRARDSAGNQGEGRSGLFRIVPRETADTIPPTVAVGAPSTGQILSTGSVSTITWTSSDNLELAAHEIALSRDGGLTFNQTLASGLPANASNFAWTIASSQETSTGVIVVRARDTAGNIGEGRSGLFSIRSSDTQPPVVSQVFVAGGAKKVKRGDSVMITWNTTDDQTVTQHRIQLSTDGGNSFPTPLVEGLAGTAREFTWIVSSSLSKSKTAVIRVQATDQANNIGQSQSTTFKIK